MKFVVDRHYGFVLVLADDPYGDGEFIYPDWTEEQWALAENMEGEWAGTFEDLDAVVRL